jgi:hypothetical protein
MKTLFLLKPKLGIYILTSIKKFLKPTIPEGSLRGISPQYRGHFDLRAKSRNFVFYLTRNCGKAAPTYAFLSLHSSDARGEVNRKTQRRAFGEFIDYK